MVIQKQRVPAGKKSNKKGKNVEPQMESVVASGSHDPPLNIVETQAKKRRKLTPVEAEIGRIQEGKTISRQGRTLVQKIASPAVRSRVVDFVEDGNYVHMESEGMDTEFLNEGESDPESDLEGNTDQHDEEPSRNNNATISNSEGTQIQKDSGTCDHDGNGSKQTSRQSQTQSQSPRLRHSDGEGSLAHQRSRSSPQSESQWEITPEQGTSQDEVDRSMSEKGVSDKRSKRDKEIEQLKSEIANVSRSFARLQKMMTQTCGASAAVGEDPVE